MSTQQLTAADLSREHHGWELRYDRPKRDDDMLPFPGRRTITLVGIRRWTNQHGDMVGLLAEDPDGVWRGIEYCVRADTPVALKRPMPRVRKPRKNDYPEAAA